MPTVVCEVINKKGMHARAAARIVSIVKKHQCQVELTHLERSAPGNSLIKLLTLNAPQGSVITIDSHGSDAEQLNQALKRLFSQGFGE